MHYALWLARTFATPPLDDTISHSLSIMLSAHLSLLLTLSLSIMFSPHLSLHLSLSLSLFCMLVFTLSLSHCHILSIFSFITVHHFFHSLLSLNYPPPSLSLSTFIVVSPLFSFIGMMYYSSYLTIKSLTIK